MQIRQGLIEGMVTQRTSENVSDALFAGRCKNTGVVRARVSRDGAVLPGFDGLAVGNAAKGRLDGRLAGIPAGGPYQVDLWIDGTTERVVLSELYVGDVWILGGQSNMQGCGMRKPALPAMPQVRAFYMDDRWAPAKDPIHNIWDAVDETHVLVFNVKPVKDSHRGVGPGVAFGQEMYERSGVPQGLIACAHGGTSMSQWDPKLKREGGRSLYGATLRRFNKNGGKVAGILWYQGCSDANPENAPLYTKRMKTLIQSFRRDLGDANLPFVAVQIAGVYNTAFDSTYWNSIQEQQRRLPNVVKRCNTVPVIDLTYADPIHLDSPSQYRLGKRLADAMTALLNGDPLTKQPISLKKVSMKANQFLSSMDITLDFDHVVGNLKAAGKPAGFSLVSKAGESLIFRTEIAGKKVILHSNLSAWEIDHKELWHGHGVVPYCNITDAADRALPVFGPVNIGKLRALTPFVRALRVSPALPLSGAVEDLPLLSGLSLSDLQARTFPEKFLNVYDAWQGSADPKVIWFACRFKCAETMQLSLSLGYDGPVAAWLDGNRVISDPKGINPALPDEKMLPFPATEGEHEVLVALSSNCNRAWGIFLRFERHDVSKKQIEQDDYLMPEILETADELVPA